MKDTKSWDDEVEVMDLYLASYYLVRGCTVARVSCIPTGKDYRCNIVMKGPWDLVGEIQKEYFHNKATVNLLAFRDAYNQINSCIRQAKKSYERGARGGAL